jgi:hypothetical protein
LLVGKTELVVVGIFVLKKLGRRKEFSALVGLPRIFTCQTEEFPVIGMNDKQST